MRRHRQIGERNLAAGEKAALLGECAQHGERRDQRLAAAAHRLHVGGAAFRRAGLGLRRLLEDDAPGHGFVELRHRPVEQAQGFGALSRVLGQQRLLGIAALST